MKNSIIVVSLVILALSGWFGYKNFLKPQYSDTQINGPKTSEKKTEKTSLSLAIETALAQKIKVLEDISRQPEIITAVEAQNVINASLKKDDIQKLDTTWQSAAGADDFIRPFITNDIGVALATFQDNNPGFVEIFITDAYGLIAGETNKTSDYLQSDEAWWVKAYNKGIGKSYYGELEYDQSAKSESIALYVPVYNSQKTVIGVVKGVYAISALPNEL